MSTIRFGPLDHCSILVTNLEKARSFYVGVLGLKEIAKPRTFDFVVIWFDLGNGQTLHLLQKPRPDTQSPRHFALTVRNAKAAREHIRAHGIAMEETVEIPHCDRFFIHDPDGNRIELIQWLEPYDPAASGAARLD
jgi:catechol 2,3-dioxygenase-like lactoylglutathione lyase family enzyme